MLGCQAPAWTAPPHLIEQCCRADCVPAEEPISARVQTDPHSQRPEIKMVRDIDMIQCRNPHPTQSLKVLSTWGGYGDTHM